MNTAALRTTLEALNAHLDETPVLLRCDDEWHTVIAVQADEDRVILSIAPFHRPGPRHDSG